jgi:hypothetical protein
MDDLNSIMTMIFNKKGYKWLGERLPLGLAASFQV